MNLNGLVPEFRSAVENVLHDCNTLGVVMRPYFMIRTPAEQAIIWRRSRSSKQVAEAIETLNENGAPWLARVLNDVGPQSGEWGTNALPGQSWHQYGEAVDCCWIVDGNYCWDVTDSKKNGYRVYAEVSRNHGLTNLGESIRDWAHTQLQRFSKPNYDWVKIDQLMQERFT